MSESLPGMSRGPPRRRPRRRPPPGRPAPGRAFAARPAPRSITDVLHASRTASSASIPSSVASRKRSFTTDSARMSWPTSAAAIARLGIVPHSLGSIRLPAGRRKTDTIPSRSGLRKYGALLPRRPRALSPVKRELSMLATIELRVKASRPGASYRSSKDGESGAPLSSPFRRLLGAVTQSSLAREHDDEAVSYGVHGVRALRPPIRANQGRPVSALRPHPLSGGPARRPAEPLAGGAHRSRHLRRMPPETRSMRRVCVFAR